MTELQKLKEQLGDAYRFEMIISPSDVKIILQNNNNKFFSDMVVFSLLAGCVGIEATIMDRCLRHEPNEKLKFLRESDDMITDLFIRYDVIVRAKQTGGEWCNHAPLETAVNLETGDVEQEMLNIVFSYAQKHNLSFTELHDLDKPRFRLIPRHD